MARWCTVPYVGSYTALDVHHFARRRALKPGRGHRVESNGESISYLVRDNRISTIVNGRVEEILLNHTVPGYGGNPTCPTSDVLSQPGGA